MSTQNIRSILATLAAKTELTPAERQLQHTLSHMVCLEDLIANNPEDTEGNARRNRQLQAAYAAMM